MYLKHAPCLRWHAGEISQGSIEFFHDIANGQFLLNDQLRKLDLGGGSIEKLGRQLLKLGLSARVMHNHCSGKESKKESHNSYGQDRNLGSVFEEDFPR